MKLVPRDRKRAWSDKLHRRHLPFYMRPVSLITFIVISLVGGFMWAWLTRVYFRDVNPLTCSFGFAFGIVLGFIHGKGLVRLWRRDYLRVLKREISFWDAKGATGSIFFVILALALPIVAGLFLFPRSYTVLAGLQSYVFGFIGGMNAVLYAWVRQLPR